MLCHYLKAPCWHLGIVPAILEHISKGSIYFQAWHPKEKYEYSLDIPTSVTMWITDSLLNKIRKQMRTYRRQLTVHAKIMHY